MPELLRIDETYDRENASDGLSRFGIYLEHSADEVQAAADEDDAWGYDVPRNWLAALVRTATGPVMSPGYVRVSGGNAYGAYLTRCNQTGADLFAVKVDLLPGHMGLRAPNPEWRDAAELLREPRPTMETTATFRIPVDLTGILRPTAPLDLNVCKSALVALTYRVNVAARTSGLLEAVTL